LAKSRITLWDSAAYEFRPLGIDCLSRASIEKLSEIKRLTGVSASKITDSFLRRAGPQCC